MELLRATKEIYKLTEKYNWTVEEKRKLEKVLINFGREKIKRLTIDQLISFKRTVDKQV